MHLLIVISTLVVIAFSISAILTKVFCNPSAFVYLLDHPNERSLHTQPTPRTGGIAILAAVIATSSLALFLDNFPLYNAGLIIAVLLIAIFSYLDDRSGITVPTRLIVHGIAALFIIMGGETLVAIYLPGLRWDLSDGVGVIVTLLFLLWMTNLYNFMDGMDGFAGGMTVFGFTTLAIVGWEAGNDYFIISNLIIAAAAAGFLVFNFPPAKIFMGDAGSSTLGMLTAAQLLWADKTHIMPLWIGIIIFSPFIVDATVTLIRRLVLHEKIWLAHKTHYYQRLVLLGWGHKKTVLVEYSLILFCCGSALFVSRLGINLQWITVGMICIVFILFIQYVNIAERRMKAE